MDVHIALAPIPVPQGHPKEIIKAFMDIAKVALVADPTLAAPDAKHGTLFFTINSGHALGHVFEGEGDLADVLATLVKDERPDAVLLEIDQVTEIRSLEDPSLTPVKRRGIVFDYKDGQGEVCSFLFFSKEGREVIFLPEPDQTKRSISYEHYLKGISFGHLDYLG
jgi:hypothetical protein